MNYEQILNSLQNLSDRLLIPSVLFVVVFAAGWIARQILFRKLRKLAAATKVRIDDVLLDSLRFPVLLWMLILAIHVATQNADLSPRASALVAKTLLVLWMVSVTWTLANLAGKVVILYGDRLQGALPVTTITQSLAVILVAVTGGLLILNALGISIAPILTALGVGGLAVALALQDTLANFFAGFYISVSGQIRLNDYVKLDSGDEGYITDIGWRTTVLRTLPNNAVLIPNAKLAQAIVTNYHLPNQPMSLLVPVGVSYDSDPDHIERILIDEATAAAGEVPGLLADPAPFVRFIPGFGDSSLNFTLICRVKEFVDQYLVQHELRKRIFARFRREGVEIPFPIRTVYLRGEGAEALKTRAAGSGGMLDHR
ncbi:MAG: mechanosensitive ion channel family protein [Bryobacteraceae bacterium]